MRRPRDCDFELHAIGLSEISLLQDTRLLGGRNVEILRITRLSHSLLGSSDHETEEAGEIRDSSGRGVQDGLYAVFPVYQNVNVLTYKNNRHFPNDEYS
jgi:hypothetical protein